MKVKKIIVIGGVLALGGAWIKAKASERALQKQVEALIADNPNIF